VGEHLDESSLVDPTCGLDPVPAGDGGTNDGPRFSQLMNTVFTPTCATGYCHQKDPPPVAPMSLDGPKAYTSLVNVASVQAPGMKRVAPGDPANSYLMHKLRGTAAGIGGSGAPVTQMPLNKPALSPQVLKDIEAWIKRGAPND
jgi:hypothetical protein